MSTTNLVDQQDENSPLLPEQNESGDRRARIWPAIIALWVLAAVPAISFEIILPFVNQVRSLFFQCVLRLTRGFCR